MIGRGRDMIEKLEFKSFILYSHMLPFKKKKKKKNNNEFVNVIVVVDVIMDVLLETVDFTHLGFVIGLIACY
jgi:hypothetical protein